MNRRIRNSPWLLCLLLFLAPLWLVAGPQLDTNNIPHTLAELNRWYVEPPTNENGATYFLQAWDVLSRDLQRHCYTNDDGEIYTNIPSLPFTDLLYTNTPLPRATNAAMAPLIKRIKMAWPLFERGARCEQSRYPTDLTEGWDGSITYLSEVRSDVFACALLALSQADARQEKPAGESILMILSIARSLEAQPSLVSQQIRDSNLNVAVRALEQTINRVNLSNDTLNRLQKAFNDIEKQETEGTNYTRAWIGQKLMMSSYFDLSSNQLAKTAKEFTVITNDMSQIPQLIAKGWKTKDSDRKQLDEMFDRVINVSKQEYPARLAIDGIMSSVMSDLATRQFGFSFLTNGGVDFAGSQQRLIVRLRLAQTAIALERYRALHENQYPESLDTLVPEYLSAVPKNIFSDPVLHYELHGHGYLLHAFYPIRQSDGGTTEMEMSFRVTNPPGRAIVE